MPRKTNDIIWTQPDRRVAIYTRKSTEEGLDLEFNSLDSQREYILDYIRRQNAGGANLQVIPQSYDDGGYSGKDTKRPALKRLLEDVDSGLVDVVMVYKLDRISRSMSDFLRLMERLAARGVGFVAVTQPIDTASPAGRMTQNMLMCMAQFERELDSERQRDKAAASRRKGIWTGGALPYGYLNVEKKLVPDPFASKVVAERIFKRFTECGSAPMVARELNEANIRNYKGNRWRSETVAMILRNHVYAGEVFFQGEVYPGAHEPIVSKEVWTLANQLLEEDVASRRQRGQRTLANSMNGLSPLTGIIRCGHCDSAMTPTWTRKKNGLKYCYYACVAGNRDPARECPVKRVPAGQMEMAVLDSVADLMRTPTFVNAVVGEGGVGEDEVMEALSDVHEIWNDLFPVERARLLRLLVREVTVRETGIQIHFALSGAGKLIEEMHHDDE